MSDNVSKVVLRAEIEELAGADWDKAYKFFRNAGFDKPDDWDGIVETGETNYFYYEEKVGAIIPIHDYDDSGKWGVDLILGRSYDYEYECTSISLEELNEKITQLQQMIGKRNWKIHSYTYYNGADEPIQF